MILPIKFREYLEENLNVPVHPISTLAKKHNKPLDYMKNTKMYSESKAKIYLL